MKNTKIPLKIKEQAIEQVAQYNAEHQTNYEISFRSKFAYLQRIDEGEPTKIGRLTYNSKGDKWSFAVFKYSNEKYDANEWLFPGHELLDGTIEGAMTAGMEIYPPSGVLGFGCNPVGCLLAIFIIPIQLILNLFRKLLGR